MAATGGAFRRELDFVFVDHFALVIHGHLVILQLHRDRKGKIIAIHLAVIDRRFSGKRADGLTGKLRALYLEDKQLPLTSAASEAIEPMNRVSNTRFISR